MKLFDARATWLTCAEQVSVLKVSCNTNSSGALDSLGRLWVWGNLISYVRLVRHSLSVSVSDLLRLSQWRRQSYKQPTLLAPFDELTEAYLAVDFGVLQDSVIVLCRNGKVHYLLALFPCC